jgi:hypothetical protein
MRPMTKRLAAAALASAALVIALGYGGSTAPTAQQDVTQPVASKASAHRPAVAPRTADLRAAVRDLAAWPLPRDARLQGVSESRLADSLENWIATLPAAKQEEARRYAARYAPAYDVDDKAVQAWLLDMGFPSLEEFAAFDYARDAASCPATTCSNPKVAALASDHFIAQMELALPPPAADGGRNLDGLDDASRRAASQAYVQAGLYADRLRQSGQVLFAAYLDARREQALGHSGRAAASRLFIAGCGDRRMSLDADQTGLAMALLQNAYGSPCNNVGKPAFPLPQGALAARR